MLTYLYSLGLQCFDDYGQRLVSGAIYAYSLGTTSHKVTYQDVYGLVPNTNPIILDHAGRASVYLNGSYTLRLVDKDGVDIENIDIRGSAQDSLSTSATGTWADNEVIVVENYAAVRALNSPYAIVFCQGRQTQNDGSEGWFALDISSLDPDDDSVILKPNTTGVYRRLNVQVIDPRWSGVVYDSIVSQAIYLSAASVVSIRHAKPLEIAGNIYINSNFETSANVIFSDNGSLVSTLPINVSFYSKVIGGNECFGISVQPKFFANDEIFYSWMDAENTEGKVSKFLASSNENCLLNFDEDISTTNPIIIPSNFTFKSNKTITFSTTSPIDLTIPKIEAVYDNVFNFQALSTVGTITISDQITPGFFGATGSGDESISVLAALKAGNIKMSQSLSSTAANITTGPIIIVSDNIDKATMPSIVLNSLAFSSLTLKNINFSGSLNGLSLQAQNSKISCTGSCNNVVYNDVEVVSGKILTVDSELENVVYLGSEVPCSKISKLTNSQFTNLLMTGTDKIEGVVSNVTITPTSANSIILKNSLVQNLYYNDSSDTFKPVLVLSGNNIINNSNFYAKNYKMLCQGNSSSATFNSCTFSDNITVSEASNNYNLNGCEGGTLEINGERNDVEYRTKTFTSGVLTDSLTNWVFHNSGGFDELESVNVTLEDDYFVFGYPYYFDNVYGPISKFTGNSADTENNYTYSYVPPTSALETFLRFGGRLKVSIKNGGNSYFKIAMAEPEYRWIRSGVNVPLNLSAESLWTGSKKLYAETGVISNDSSNIVTTEFSYNVNSMSFRPVVFDATAGFGATYPILLTDALGRRSTVLNTSAATPFQTNCDVYFIGFIDNGAEIKIEFVSEIPVNNNISQTYFKNTSASNDTYLNYFATDDRTYTCSGTNKLSDKWLVNVDYTEIGDKIVVKGICPSIIDSTKNISGFSYNLIRNGWSEYVDQWKFVKNIFDLNLTNIMSCLVVNDVEIVLETLTDDTTSLSAAPSKLIKKFSTNRFYKSIENLS